VAEAARRVADRVGQELAEMGQDRQEALQRPLHGDEEREEELERDREARRLERAEGGGHTPARTGLRSQTKQLFNRKVSYSLNLFDSPFKLETVPRHLYRFFHLIHYLYSGLS
jgi:hypothetical protein